MTLVLWAWGLASWCQSPSPLTFSGGLLAGMTTSEIRGDQAAGFDKFGCHVGGLLDIRRSETIGFQLGMVYNQKGSRKVPNWKIGDYVSWRYKFTYIDIPITVIYDFLDGFTVGTGLQPGVLLRALEDGVVEQAVTGNYTETTLPIRPFELSWIVWVGIRKGERGEWYLRHAHSLLGIVPREFIPNPASRRFNRMQNFTLQLGYAWLVLG